MSLTKEQRDRVRYALDTYPGVPFTENTVRALLDALEEMDTKFNEVIKLQNIRYNQLADSRHDCLNKLATAQETIGKLNDEKHLLLATIDEGLSDDDVHLACREISTLRTTHRETVEALKWAASELQRKIYAVHFLHSRAGKQVGDIQADQEACTRCAGDTDYLKTHALTVQLQHALGDGGGQG